jgi:hypothetical protein
MNLAEGVALLNAAATELTVSTRRLDLDAFRGLAVATGDQDYPLGDPRRVYTDGAPYLIARVEARPQHAAGYLALSREAAAVLIRTAQCAALLPADCAELCPCITVRLWHPALAVARALAGVDVFEGCAAVQEAMR